MRAAIGLGLAERLGGPAGVISLAIGAGVRAFWRSRVRHEVLAAVGLLIAWTIIKTQVGPLGAALVFLAAGVAAWRGKLPERWRAIKMQSRFRQASGYLTNGTGRIRISGTRTRPNGYTSSIRFSHGAHCGSLDLRAGAAHLPGVHALRVARSEHQENRGTLTTYTRDPFVDMVQAPPVPWPGPRGNAWTPFPFGTDETGETVELSLMTSHGAADYLIGGLKGSGKSTGLHALIAAAAADPDVYLFLIDAKGGVELGAWESRADGFADTVAASIDLLARTQQIMLDRYAEMRGRARKVDETWSTVVVAIDELAVLTNAQRQQSDRVEELLFDLLQRGRAAGICVIAATQRLQGDTVPTRIRSMFTRRIAFRCGDRHGYEAVLGIPWESDDTIPEGWQGVALLLAEGSSTPRRIRTFQIDDDRLAGLAEQAKDAAKAAP